eukprot:g1223.t1
MPDENRRRSFFLFCGLWGAFIVYSVASSPGGGIKANYRTDTLPVIWYAPFFSGGGYCSEAISFALALRKAGVRVQIVQHGDGVNRDFVHGLPRGERELLVDMSQEHIDPRHAVVVCHSEPGAWHPSRWPTAMCPPPRSKYTVGRTMFETDRLPDGWDERLNKMDELWVPADFHVKTFREGGAKASKLVVLGEPVDIDFFNPDDARELTVPRGDERETRFLSIFKWETRKGWDVLLKAYFHEFKEADNVCLYLLTNPFHSTSDFDAEIRKYTVETLKMSPDALPKVVVLRPGLPQSKMPGLFQSVDALVQPSRGEGWGRPHVEAMSMGIPVVATNWSGTTEFLTEENSYPLRYDGMSEIQDGAFKGHHWAEPSSTHLQEILRDIHEHKDRAQSKGKQGRKDMMKFYSPSVMAEQVISRLQEIEKKIKKQRPPPIGIEQEGLQKQDSSLEL